MLSLEIWLIELALYHLANCLMPASPTTALIDVDSLWLAPDNLEILRSARADPCS